MASIARRNLLEDLPRFLVAQAGIMFAVSLVTIQTGILNGFTRSTSLLIDHSNADLWVSAAEMVHLELTIPIPAQQVSQVQQVPGVAQAEPLIIRGSTWRSAEGEIRPVQVIGFNPDSPLFTPWQITQGELGNLKQPYSVIVDQTNQDNLDLTQIGTSGTIGSLPATLVGITQGTQSIISGTGIFTSLENANAYVNSGFTSRVSCQLQSGGLECTNVFQRSQQPPAQVTSPAPLSGNSPISYILVKAQPGQDLEVLKQRLQAALPGTRAQTQTEMAERVQNYWQTRTGIGFILALGATVGVIVGIVIVGQILYSSVSDHLKEFGTLKAMGASDWLIYRIIIEQALWMSILGYIPSMALCLGLGTWTYATQGIMILITPGMAVGVLGVTIAMCVGSALFAIQKVTHVDPAIVFKA